MRNDVLDMETPVRNGLAGVHRGGRADEAAQAPASDIGAGRDQRQDRDQYTPQVGLGASLPGGGWRPSPEG